MKQAIYETKGRAREFNELALNLFTGCGHGCIYCWAPDVLHLKPSQFAAPVPRVKPADILRSAEAQRKKGDKRRVLLCFTCDPYQPVEAETQLTRTTIGILHRYGIGVVILTKGGRRAMRDFDLLQPGLDAFAVTLTLTDDKHSRQWEPGAALPQERIDSLEVAYHMGIETWVSLEPVIYPAITMELVKLTHEFTGHYKVGTLNYHPLGKKTDWKTFGWQIKALLDVLNAKYYFKRDLLDKMGVKDFEQTWRCG